MATTGFGLATYLIRSSSLILTVSGTRSGCYEMEGGGYMGQLE